MLRRRVCAFALVAVGTVGAEQAPVQAPHGRPLLQTSPRNRVLRGERVIVEVTSGAARLAFETTAESAGGIGNFVLVRNPANGRLFPAKVAAKGKVVVQR